jgi:predicted Zn-dependent protease
MALAVLCIPFSAVAHVGVEEELKKLSQLIVEQPENSQLYVLRGETYCLHGDWDSAIKDYHKALDINPNDIAATTGLGGTYVDKGDYQQAIVYLNRALTKEPDNVRALILIAQASSETGQQLAAATYYTRIIKQFRHQTKPLPDYYLERARSLAAAGDQYIDQALQGLDEGINVLGKIRTLELYAVELESSRGNFEAALKRLDSILANAVRKELLLLQRGDILTAAGRTTDAVQVYHDAQAAIDAIPPQRRYTRAVLQAQSELNARLSTLEMLNAIN